MDGGVGRSSIIEHAPNDLCKSWWWVVPAVALPVTFLWTDSSSSANAWTILAHNILRPMDRRW